MLRAACLRQRSAAWVNLIIINGNQYIRNFHILKLSRTKSRIQLQSWGTESLLNKYRCTLVSHTARYFLYFENEGKPMATVWSLAHVLRSPVRGVIPTLHAGKKAYDSIYRRGFLVMVATFFCYFSEWNALTKFILPSKRTDVQTCINMYFRHGCYQRYCQEK